jgi:hypothetical protein
MYIGQCMIRDSEEEYGIGYAFSYYIGHLITTLSQRPLPLVVAHIIAEYTQFHWWSPT